MITMNENDIAIVGMACRFPGAASLAEYWSNLRDGISSIQTLTEEELLEFGASATDLADPAYVKACPVLEGVDQFDASFFGLSPRDASVMDPAHRMFLEVAWEAMEHAGQTALSEDGAVGVFATSGAPYYLMDNVRRNPSVMESMGEFLVRHTNNDMNFLATRVSYEMDLRGPSLNIQTACSSALVAVHVACESIRRGDCVVALAGGATVNIPHRHGYTYREGEILSPDGVCRPFDARSAGTVFGSGIGCIVLKKLSAALDEGDTIHAVIKGSAINNDGAQRVGFLAPGVDGQAAVVCRALDNADVPADSITYIEAHGTGTSVGDPIEVEALKQAFRDRTARRQFCAIGSVKSNIGHLGEAAGIASLIKAVLALTHRQLPASLGFEAPNPLIGFAESPFFVNDRLRPWQVDGPRRCGITALGAGGTNCHVILEEAPDRLEGEGARGVHLLVVSAKTQTALARARVRLADAIEADESMDMADVAYTLSVGRRHMSYRRMFVVRDRSDALVQLRERDSATVKADSVDDQVPGIAFMFPGGGVQFVRMGLELYKTERVYRDSVNECLTICNARLGCDLGALMFPLDGSDADHDRVLEGPSLSLSSLFTAEYAMAKLFASWGIQPTALVGHSMGEYVAACLSSVMTLKDALELVIERGQLFESVPRGGMLSVSLPESDLRALMPVELDIAAVNAPGVCTVSGPAAIVESFEGTLAQREIEHARVRINVAAHSAMLDQVLDRFRTFCRTIELRTPQIPFVSNLSGRWISSAEATDPEYWVKHLRGTVRFADCVETLLRDREYVLLEMGPGRTLSSLARAQRTPAQHTLNAMQRATEKGSDVAVALTCLGRLWQAGVEVDWPAVYDGQLRNRIPLPTYAWDHRRHWVAPTITSALNVASASPISDRRELVEDWFTRLGWRQTLPAPALVQAEEQVLLFSDTTGFADEVGAALAAAGRRVTIVRAGEEWQQRDGEYVIRPSVVADHERLIRMMATENALPWRVVHAWGVGEETPRVSLADVMETGFHCLLAFAQAMSTQAPDMAVQLDILTSNLQHIGGEELLDPAKATTLGPARVFPREYASITTRCIDVVLPSTARRRSFLAGLIAAEVGSASLDETVAYRGSERFVQFLEAARLAPTVERIRRRGVYLITGGLGGIGYALAEHLAHTYHARLVLIGRSADALRAKSKVAALEACGAEVELVQADVTDVVQVRAAIARGLSRFGELNGVFHTAGTLDDKLMAFKSGADAERVLAPKVAGTLALDAAIGDTRLDLFVLFSSISSIAGLQGQADYTAANAFLDAFAHERTVRTDSFTIAINWSAWRDVGMVAAIARGVSPGDALADELHPVFGRRTWSDAETEIFATSVASDTHWAVGEHRLRGGPRLMPGTGFLDLAAAILLTRTGSYPLEIRDLSFMTPLIVKDDHPCELRVHVSRGGGGSASLVIASRDVGGDTLAWTEHATATAETAGFAAPKWLDLVAIMSRCTIDVKQHPGAEESTFMDFGPRWRCLRTSRYGVGEALLSLELPNAFAADLDLHPMHPALMDMATGSGWKLIAGFDPTTDFYVPLSYTKVRIYAPLTPRIHSHVRLVQSDFDRKEAAVFDITIVDDSGCVLAEIEQYVMRRITDASVLHNASPPARIRRSLVDFAPKTKAVRPPALTDWTADAILTSEGMAALDCICAGPALSQIFATPIPAGALIEQVRCPRGRSDEHQPRDEAARIDDTAAIHVDAPRNETERAIAAIWTELLGVDRVGVHDNFFDLGGHSLLVMRMAARLRRTFGISPALPALFSAGTLGELAGLIDGTQSPDSSSARRIASRAQQDVSPLSSMQQRVWFMEQLHPGRRTYHIPQAQRLYGPIDPAALDHAANALVLRHPALRTVLDGESDPVQRVQAPARSTLFPAEPVPGSTAEEREARLADRLAELSAEPFAFAVGPLFRMHLFQLSAEEHVMFLMSHHIIADGLSMLLVHRDLAELYRAYVAGVPPKLPVLPVTYGDFVEWHRSATETSAHASQLAHWVERLSGLGEPLDLPTDFARPAQTSNESGTVSFRVDAKGTAALRAFVAMEESTLFMGLMAAYIVFLQRHTGQTDFVVGMPVHGRGDVDLEPVVGFFANTLPLRVSAHPTDSYRDVLRRTRAALLEALRHPDVPFELIVRKLKLPRDESRFPVFQTLLALQDWRQRPTEWGDLQSLTQTLPVTGIAEDVALWLTEHSQEVAADLAYSTDLFDHDTAALFGERYAQLIAHATASPDLPIGDLVVLLPSERDALTEWNATDQAYDRSLRLHDLAIGQAHRTPDERGVSQAGHALSYAELDAQSNQLARLLRLRGVSRGALVGLCMERTPQMVVSLLAILKAGGVYVPLDPSYPADRLAYIVDDAQLTLLVTESSLVHAVDWPREQSILLDIDVFALSEQSLAPLPPSSLDARATDPAYVLYTSGSTGRPKGVVVPHRAVVNLLMSMAKEPGLSARDRLVAVTTLSFDIAVLELFLPLTVGAEVILASQDQAADGRALRLLLESSRATAMQATPSTWRMLVEAGWHGSPSFKALIGGESVPIDVASALVERAGAVWNVYGPTETTVWSTCWRIQQPELGIAIGRPIANTTVHVLDDQRRLCPIGVPGELYIGGDGVALGYLRRTELTTERFVPDPFAAGRTLYRTGDRGRWRHDGQLEHQGRLDFQVKVRGHRIELGEIETCLLTHDAVARALVVVREDSLGDARLTAYVVPRASMPSASVLREHLRAVLPEYMLPQHYVHLLEIPLLPNGKIDRSSLPLPTPVEVAHNDSFAAPRTDSELGIAAIWMELLGVDRVGVHDNFFDLGGHSLLAMSAVLQIEQKVGLKLNVRRIIFETLGQLASLPARAGSVVVPENLRAMERRSKVSDRVENQGRS